MRLFGEWRGLLQSLTEYIRIALLANGRTVGIITAVWRKRKPFPFMLYIVNTDCFFTVVACGTVDGEVDFVIHWFQPCFRSKFVCL